MSAVREVVGDERFQMSGVTWSMRWMTRCMWDACCWTPCLPRKEEPRPSRRPGAQQVLQEVLAIAPAAHKGAVAQPATRRAVGRSGNFVYCACHAKRSRGQARRAAGPSKGFCVLRLPQVKAPREMSGVRWYETSRVGCVWDAMVWDELCGWVARDEMCE